MARIANTVSGSGLVSNLNSNKVNIGNNTSSNSTASGIQSTYAQHQLNLVDNYIYLYHIDTFIVLPGYADSVTDNLSVNFASTTPLSRSAPIYSYQNSGPRTVQVAFNLHRDMMTQLNAGVSNANLGLSNSVLTSPNASTVIETQNGNYVVANWENTDYTDFIINAVQAAALPSYRSSQKLVNPPLVAVRLGNDIFIKGVIQGGVMLTYKYPILRNGKYSNVDISFTVTEVDPYDAETVVQTGSYRGLTTTLERRIYGAVGNGGQTTNSGTIIPNTSTR